MLRNILFILLFLLVYGAIFLIGSYRPNEALTDRAENGTFSTETDGGIRYVSDRYGLTFDYEPDWIIFDGVQLEKQIRDLGYTDEEIEDAYDCELGNLVFLGGFLSPGATLRITVEKDNAIPPDSFSSSDLQKLIDYQREMTLYAGGVWGSGNGFVLPAQGNAARVLLYYYDYEYLGEYDATFCAMLNVNGNIVMLDGYYNDVDGLTTLTEFVKKGMTVTSSGDSAI
ncbi:MAG: hypothetical protein NC084_07245 [Bacteroides sp.]|nr:hypothetical protein [Eubacterium sp.]MCM1418393.1 hypothetical protein [Roseburia sp.]MCM1462494.1 hypothetical protein [Bacteroides sp.]